MTWITPLLAEMSVAITRAPSTNTPPSLTLKSIRWPLSDVASLVEITFEAGSSPLTTWYVRIAASFWRFSGFSRSLMVFWPSLAKASSVGANTVRGPLLLRASARPAA